MNRNNLLLRRKPEFSITFSRQQTSRIRQFTEKLVNWADIIRKAFAEGAISDIISTRRLVHICQAYAIFGEDREKAIQLCLNRFDVDTKNSFMHFYKKLDESLAPAHTQEAQSAIGLRLPFEVLHKHYKQLYNDPQNCKSAVQIVNEWAEICQKYNKGYIVL